MKIIKRYGGGGGGQQQTHSTIPDWMRPYLEKGLSQSSKALDAGELSKVAGFTPEQRLAQAASKGVATTQMGISENTLGNLGVLSRAAQGEEIVPTSTGATEALKAGAVRQAQTALQPGIASRAKSGAVGGGRQILQQNEASNDLAAKLAGIDYQDLQSRRQGALGAAGQAISAGSEAQKQAEAGASTLRGVGSEIQKQNQAELDKTFQGLSRFSSLVQGTPWQSQQQVQQGGK